MNQFEQFQAALDLTKVSDNIFSFTPDSRYFVGNTPHGGYPVSYTHLRAHET